MEIIQSLELKIAEIKKNKYQHKYYLFDIPVLQKDEFINHLFDFAGNKELTFRNNMILPNNIDCILHYCGLVLLIRFINKAD